MNKSLKISQKTSHAINPDMIGLFFEDINFAADGGLYAELLENCSFEAVKSCGVTREYQLEGDYLYAWGAATEGAKLEINENMPLNEKNPHYLRFTAANAGDAFFNKAYDGIYFRKGMNYKISFYAREVHYLKGEFEIAITKDGSEYASGRVAFTPAQPEEPDDYNKMIGNCEAKVWKKYEAVISADIAEDIEGCRFELRLTEPGVVEFKLISMIPEDAVAGIFRKDLFEALAALKPGFLRFPGGCIVEGTSIMRRYRWKDTVGELKDRKINTNLWATQGGNTLTAWEMPDSHYMQSYGIGFYEYFLLCELLSTKQRRCLPLPVLNIGVACQFRSYEVVAIDSEEFDEYVQDALDLIEFANGPVDSKYGALRAKMGHPESFNMTLLAIGNEQWNSRHVDLDERYRRFEKAIHAKYPKIKCLGTAGPFVNNDLHADAWKYYRSECAKNPDFAFAVDEHYYVAPQWLFDNVNFYDEYPRDVAVFAGEYAAHNANLDNSVEAALAEAAMITGMERNGDVVKYASYAPLFNRIGHSHWTPDMIWFDEKKVVLTPSYYAQKIFSENAGSEAFELNGQEKELAASKIYLSAVKKDDKVVLKIVNDNEEEVKLELTNEDGSVVKAGADMTVLKGVNPYKPTVETEGIDPDGPCKAVRGEVMTNARLCELRKPEECTCKTTRVELDGSVLLPAMSVSVLVIG
ncbi:MAG: alpha-L-arabinofuranosidase [Lachnospiraceae bacterium]|nr:alpha-L-arabinofuranosidase [Lachnospiraceae bacterium]